MAALCAHLQALYMLCSHCDTVGIRSILPFDGAGKQLLISHYPLRSESCKAAQMKEEYTYEMGATHQRPPHRAHSLHTFFSHTHSSTLSNTTASRLLFLLVRLKVPSVRHWLNN